MTTRTMLFFFSLHGSCICASSLQRSHSRAEKWRCNVQNAQPCATTAYSRVESRAAARARAKRDGFCNRFHSQFLTPPCGKGTCVHCKRPKASAKSPTCQRGKPLIVSCTYLESEKVKMKLVSSTTTAMRFPKRLSHVFY